MSGEDSSIWFVKYGGPQFWQCMGERFYQKVVQHPVLRKYFDGMRPNRVKEVAGDMWQITLGFSGPWSELAIASTHKRLLILDGDFDVYVRLLKETLFEEGLEDEDIEEIEANINGLKALVCGD